MIYWGNRDRIVIGFKTTYAISASHHYRSVLDTTLCDKVCQRFAAGQLVSPGTPLMKLPPQYRGNIVA
jgi:hypothetical protein